MGAAAQVLPGDRPVAAHVVVHGEAATANLDGGALGALALRGDQFELVGLVGQLDSGLVLADLAAHEALPLLDDALHALLQLAQQLGRDGVDVAEVVVEAVGDEGTDAQVHVGEEALDGLGEHVGGAVAQDVQAVRRVQGDGLDAGARLQLGVQVAGGPVDFDGDDGAVARVPGRARGPRLDGGRLSVDDEVESGHGGSSGRCVRRRGSPRAQDQWRFYPLVRRRQDLRILLFTDIAVRRER